MPVNKLVSLSLSFHPGVYRAGGCSACPARHGKGLRLQSLARRPPRADRLACKSPTRLCCLKAAESKPYSTPHPSGWILTAPFPFATGGLLPGYGCQPAPVQRRGAQSGLLLSITTGLLASTSHLSQQGRRLILTVLPFSGLRPFLVPVRLD